MKEFNEIDAVVTKEEAIFECMKWMEDKIKDAVEYLMKQNEDTLKQGDNDLYCEGYYDALVDILYELEIEMEN